nr:MAG TPA: ENDO-1,4-BETA MANNANASE, PUTATIVE, MAN26C [Caudoviricetes sp.]
MIIKREAHKKMECMMGKAKRKPKPSMPDWYWWGQDGC